MDSELLLEDDTCLLLEDDTCFLLEDSDFSLSIAMGGGGLGMWRNVRKTRRNSRWGRK